MSTTFLRRAALLLPAALLAPTVDAQVIAWDAPLPALAATDVNLTGSLLVARNLHASGATQTPTVNGVTFLGSFAPTGWNNASTLALQGSTTGDAGYDLMLNSARATSAAATANPTGWGAIRLDTLGTLTVGRTYQIQCWFTEQRPGAGTAALYDRVMTFSSAVGAATLVGGEVSNLGALVQGPVSGALDGDLDNAPAINSPDVIFGSHITGTFTWVSPTDQLWLLVQGSHPNPLNLLRSHLTAFQIRELPQASMTFMGSGCAGTMAVSTQTVNSLPVSGGTLSLTFDNLPFNFAVGLVGFSNTLWQGIIPLPIDMTILGAPGCFARVSNDLESFLFGGGGLATMTAPVPSGLVFLGLNFYTQAAVADTANAFGFVVSDAWSGVVGL